MNNLYQIINENINKQMMMIMYFRNSLFEVKYFETVLKKDSL